MDEQDVVDALIELGLATYEARVFVALVQLGSGTARDVAEIADVPRSQVYTTADDLEERGFINSQQSNPQVYRPVSLSEVENQLKNRFESKRHTAFSRLEELEKQAEPAAEESEDIWTITGEAAITGRIIKLTQDAEERVTYYTANPQNLNTELLVELQACCDRGIEVHILYEKGKELPKIWSELDCVTADSISTHKRYAKGAVRVLVVDSDVFLLSVLRSEASAETAIWSSHTSFAEVFSQLLLQPKSG
ncbi:TrmB family transcriptional regulator [Halobellus inordinatus]|uniref:TrmB family transcriptional regulator n=1 Tax=Halobellus inordinatus TaxID=1126236 RepID=UPI0021157FAC|nr:helix-turn-helix domain-containing protein [Halobellus ramosii]